MGTNYTSPGWVDAGNIQLTRSQNGRHGVVISGPFADWLTDPDVLENLAPAVRAAITPNSDGSITITADILGRFGVSENDWTTWENLLE